MKFYSVLNLALLVLTSASISKADCSMTLHGVATGDGYASYRIFLDYPSDNKIDYDDQSSASQIVHDAAALVSSGACAIDNADLDTAQLRPVDGGWTIIFTDSLGITNNGPVYESVAPAANDLALLKSAGLVN
jgi:hypothetical protein